MCYSPWGHKELAMTEPLNNNTEEMKAWSTGYSLMGIKTCIHKIALLFT